MRTKRWMATCVVALLSVAAVLAKDIRVVVFKVSQMHCENCEKKVKNNMRFEKGVKELSTELKNKTVSITYDTEKTVRPWRGGMDARPLPRAPHEPPPEGWFRLRQ